jgi:hypothetical protein
MPAPFRKLISVIITMDLRTRNSFSLVQPEPAGCHPPLRLNRQPIGRLLQVRKGE